MSVYNADEINAPAWVNQEFLHKVISDYERDDDVEVVKFEVSPASMKGDHFASIMFRAKVAYRFTKDGPIANKSLIIKTMPVEEGEKRDMLEQSSLFETEIDMYAKTLPAIEEMLAAYGDTTKLAPKIIYHSLKPVKVIILEDLCELGYEVLRGQYLSDEQLSAVFIKIAKLHAVSMKLAQSEQHTLVTKYKEGIFNSPAVLQSPVLTEGITRFIEMLSTDDELSEYIPKVKALQKDLFEVCIQLYCAYERGLKNEIFVLNHGDFHLKNLMFKFNKKTQMEDFMMVDLQLSVFGPLNIDLNYATFMMMSAEQRSKRQVFQRVYYDQLIETLKRIEYKGDLPKFADIQMSNIRYRYFLIFLLSTFLPLHYSALSQRPEDIKDFDTTKMMNADGIVLFYRNPAYIADVKRLLPEFLYAGYLD